MPRVRSSAARQRDFGKLTERAARASLAGARGRQGPRGFVKPFGVNLTILPSRKPPPYEEYARAIIDSGVKVVETAGRSPEPFLPLFETAGVSTGLIYDIPTVAELVSRIVSDAERIINGRLLGLSGPS